MRVVRPGNDGELISTNRPGRAGAVRGLLGTESIDKGTALLLKGRRVHTIGMRYTIDVVHLDKSMTVIGVATLEPGKISARPPKARWIVELKDGEAARLGIEPGEQLEILE